MGAFGEPAIVMVGIPTFAKDSAPTLFDAGLPDSTDAFLEAIEAVGPDPKHLVITHRDPDHIRGFDAVVDHFGV